MKPIAIVALLVGLGSAAPSPCWARRSEQLDSDKMAKSQGEPAQVKDVLDLAFKGRRLSRVNEVVQTGRLLRLAASKLSKDGL
jgi:hypothetical protein